MKRVVIMILSSLSLAVMTSLSLQAAEIETNTENTTRVEQASAQTESEQQASEKTSTKKAPSKTPAVPTSKTDTVALVAVIGLVLSFLSLIIGVLCLILVLKQKGAAKVLEGRMDTKIAALKEGIIDKDEVKRISGNTAQELIDELQVQINSKFTASETPAQRQDTIAQKVAEKVFEPKTMYASFSPSYLGFRGDEVSLEQTPQATFRIRTINETKATYQLLENVSSSLVDSSQLEACEYTGNPQSYTYIRLIEEGVLEYVTGSDYWRIEKKAIISFE